MLEQRECTECGETHVLRSDGRMSIHRTRDGRRCEEPTDAPAPRSRRSAYRQGKASVVDRSEIQAAFDYAATHGGKNARHSAGSDRGVDRRIYAVGEVEFVSGGLPESGKRR